MSYGSGTGSVYLAHLSHGQFLDVREPMDNRWRWNHERLINEPEAQLALSDLVRPVSPYQVEALERSSGVCVRLLEKDMGSLAPVARDFLEVGKALDHRMRTGGSDEPANTLPLRTVLESFVEQSDEREVSRHDFQSAKVGQREEAIDEQRQNLRVFVHPERQSAGHALRVSIASANHQGPTNRT